MIKKLILIVLVMLIKLNAVYSQFAIQPGLIAPKGYSAYLLKPGYGSEVGVYAKLAEHWQMEFFVGYFKFKPTQDTFTNNYTITYNSTVRIDPSFETIKKYGLLTTNVGASYKILAESKFTPLLGFDIGINVIMLDYASGGVVSSANVSGDYTYEYLMYPKLGLQYTLSDKIKIGANAGYNFCTGPAGGRRLLKTNLFIGYAY